MPVGGTRLDLRSLLDRRGAIDMRCLRALDDVLVVVVVDSKPPARETRRLVEMPPNVVRLVLTIL